MSQNIFHTNNANDFIVQIVLPMSSGIKPVVVCLNTIGYVFVPATYYMIGKLQYPCLCGFSNGDIGDINSEFNACLNKVVIFNAPRRRYANCNASTRLARFCVPFVKGLCSLELL